MTQVKGERPTYCEKPFQFNPLEHEGCVVSGQGGAAGSETETEEHLRERIRELENTLMDHWEYHENGSDGSIPVLKVPAKPTQKEWLEHQATHTPPKSWCTYCMMGRGNRRPHRTNVPDIEEKEGKNNKISIDYMYLNDDEKKRDQLQLVMIDHNHGRVSSYSVPQKGIVGEVGWVPRDLDNMGYKDVTIQIKSDQEPAIVAIQAYIRLNRISPSIPINSPVGESECNGRVENAIRRVKEKVRTLMAQLEDGIGEKVPKGAHIIPWMVRLGRRAYIEICSRVRRQVAIRTVARRKVQGALGHVWGSSIIPTIEKQPKH